MNLGVLASHAGTLVQTILDACESGELPAAVRVVISNNSGAGALERARRHGVRAVHLSSATHRDPADLDRAVCDALVHEQVDIVFLAGYLKRVGPETRPRFRRRILNTHPALLPKFGGVGMYGDRVYAAVLASGESVTGVTIHHVAEEYDVGDFVARCSVAVLPGDTVETLRTRVSAREKRLVVETLSAIAKGEVDLDVSAKPRDL